MRLGPVWRIALVSTLSLSSIAFSQDVCERLSAIKISNATTTSAQTFAAGSYNGAPAPFSGVDVSALYKSMP
ncbi:MAG TPA: hypothetical protein VMP68_30575, partial [Candidatus Eisenbacteria bacterium]|nr:hypothetical protein [Candidatus Eisenbacteria bacterium]